MLSDIQSVRIRCGACYFFGLKNRIKHIDSTDDRQIDANIEVNARQKIGDAVTNLQRLGLRKSKQVDRFTVCPGWSPT